MRHIRGTRDLPLILSANGSHIFRWWVDASFAVHPNLRGHAGGGLSLGRGFPIVSSTKQRLNTRSSTEPELVGADDFMPAACWTRYFMEAQGYIQSRTMSYIKTTRVTSYWRKMVRLRAASVRSMLTFVISLSQIELTRMSCLSNGAPLGT
jgi:hypothetical protein